MNIEINGVSITLTTEQLAEIARQTKKIKSFSDIKTLDDAYEFLGEQSKGPKEFIRSIKLLGADSDTISYEELKVIIKAVNLCDNGTIWLPNWDDTN